MKLILSRKGFDTSIGGVPSPIFPDGSMVSLPIPETSPPQNGEASIRYADIHLSDGTSMGELVEMLTRSRRSPVLANGVAHLDPDLWPRSLTGQRYRWPGWLPLFGQSGAAEGHLSNQHIVAGDVFLFFGLFRRVDDTWQYERRSKPEHVLFGWLQVGKIWHEEDIKEAPSWARYHPHFDGKNRTKNTIYVSKEHLDLPGIDETIHGAGIFAKYHTDLRLTAEDADNVTKWRLPGWFDPKGRKPLTYHRNKEWEPCHDGKVLVDSATRGQEFILDCDHYPQALPWLTNLVKRHGAGHE